MPYVSDAQRRYFNANRSRLEAEGVDVDEWNQASKGTKLSKKVEKVAAYRGLSEVPRGFGPHRMAAALEMYYDARDLVNPAATLDRYSLSADDFNTKINQLAVPRSKKHVDRFDFSALRRNPAIEGLTAGALGALLGGGIGYLRGNPFSSIRYGATLGLGAGLIQRNRAKADNERTLATAKLLKDYGINRPSYLRDALPLLQVTEADLESAVDYPVVRLGAGAAAGGVKVAYDIANTVHMQQFSPQLPRRELSDDEQAEVAAGKKRWMPKIFQSYATPVSKLMSSPGKGALLSGAVGALSGASIGGAYGYRHNGRPGTGEPDRSHNGLVGAALGAALGGIPMAAMTYFRRKADNEGLEELMRRLPAGATRRDLLADGAYQKDLDRQMQQQQNDMQRRMLLAAMSRRME